MQTQTNLLSSSEIASLKAELRNYYITSVCLTIMVIGFMHALIFIKFDQWTVPKYEALVLTGLLAIAWLLSNIFIKPLRLEIEQGSKVVELFPIEDKFHYIDRDFEDASAYTKYVVVVGGKKYIVSEEVYLKAEIAGLLAIHKSLIREKILKIEIP